MAAIKGPRSATVDAPFLIPPGSTSRPCRCRSWRPSGVLQVGQGVARKRLEPHIDAGPARVLKRGALPAAARAPRGLPEPVARGVGSPPDNQRRERHRCAVSAVDRRAVNPEPRTAAAESGEGGGGCAAMGWHPANLAFGTCRCQQVRCPRMTAAALPSY
jgi:hypothetical protein